MNCYSDEDKKEIWNSLIAEIISGRSVRSIIKDPGMPGLTALYEWIENDELKAKQYARACKIRADLIFDEILDISDNTGNDLITLDNGKEVVNHEVINRDRLRVDSRKWMLARMNPKKYGEKIEIDNKNLPKSAPTFIFTNLNDEE